MKHNSVLWGETHQLLRQKTPGKHKLHGIGLPNQTEFRKPAAVDESSHQMALKD